MHQCSRCPRSFISLYLLRKHHRGVHSSPEHKCHRCGLVFWTRHGLEFHGYTCLVLSQKHSCDKCGFVSRRRCDLDEHMSDVHGVKRYTCDVCNMSFTRIESMRRHCYAHKYKRGKLYTCPKCPLTFTTCRKFDTHMINIHKE